MNIDTEKIINGMLYGLFSGIGIGIAVAITKIPFPDNFFLFIILILGVALGVLVGKYIWKNFDEFPGVVPFNKSKTKKRLPGEVFMAEMLQNSVNMTKENNKISVSIDRKNVKELVISNKGKKELSQKYVDTQRAQREHYEKIDRGIHQFLSGSDIKEAKVELGNNFKLRWASGGVLSVVTYNNKVWIPLFFRDIRPYGWNIALGSSERHFDEKNRVINGLENELTAPTRFLCREFLEETLIIDGNAKDGTNNSLPIIMPWSVITEDEQNKIQFEAKHLSLRDKYDGMQISKSPGYSIQPDIINSNMTINIISSNGKNGEERKNSEGGVLVCFSLLDLGIEIIKLLKYPIPTNECEFLDGEILEKFDGKKTISELTRMPVALLSCEFLHSIFSKDITEYKYTLGANPSIEINESIPPEHIHIFEWDVMKRLDIVRGQKTGVGSEKQRYTDWYDKFGINFFNSGNKISKDNPSRLFTPATAKLLNLFFRNISPDELK